MQNLFAEDTEWHTPWLERVLPVVERIARARPDRTIFTRFIPADRPGEGEGTWRRYWERWPSMTLEALPPGAVDLVPAAGAARAAGRGVRQARLLALGGAGRCTTGCARAASTRW